MTPEAPTPFTIPEVLHDEKYPPQWFDLEFQPQAMAQLMSELGQGRQSRLDRIIIRGGLVLGEREYVSRRFLPLAYNLDSDEGVLEDIVAVSDNSILRKFGFQSGHYDTINNHIVIHPDTVAVFSLLFPSRGTANEFSTTQTSAENPQLSTIKKEITQGMSVTLIDELEHSFQTGIQHVPRLLRIVPLNLLNTYFNQGSKQKREDPPLQQLAQEAVTLRQLIPDDKLSQYASVARLISQARGLISVD
ncbi:MAG: hypothetical protein A2900_05445 [Candidatus Chisholmbacteria bacterium RIFCSPLOWO2_01_FULL_50_28]|uniref:Uncharacterized protein n=1 Tax=Candidatus Chisholmbacteria bacterium RIFCSPHIGHO2_01_FULL_52_32 TaxID=1797591 RepID=A0A1G1VRV8_9BACT|nr:MAG: hypothetical protein A2786_01300 [Candidatus Chisholmbacteria bacterium RIFCSPHIGHO2_01_FULL_52_32]OGY20489.1 MAG: hypothetical protein A2900_05445 [Candidatus Chisholmbacteria bacterium RIFCSPLOWO2_01_FULL_50_28]